MNGPSGINNRSCPQLHSWTPKIWTPLHLSSRARKLKTSLLKIFLQDCYIFHYFLCFCFIQTHKFSFHLPNFLTIRWKSYKIFSFGSDGHQHFASPSSTFLFHNSSLTLINLCYFFLSSWGLMITGSWHPYHVPPFHYPSLFIYVILFSHLSTTVVVLQ